MTWRNYIGDSLNGDCWCCGCTITYEQWYTVHIIPNYKGGSNTVENLRSVCTHCNLSMSDKDMVDFATEHRVKG